MTRSNRLGDRGRPRIPRVEGLEARELLSITPLLSLAALRPHSSAQVVSGSSIQAQAGDSSGGSGGGVAGSTPTGLPTPHELARERLVAKLVGSYTVVPGRFSDQAAVVQILAQGGSTSELHANLQMVIFTPSDTVNGVTTAEAALSGRNVGSSGNTLDLSATAPPPTSAVGIPTHYTWTVGPASGGLYAGATATVPGTIDIKLIPSGKLPPRALGAGKAIIVIKGYVNTAGIFNDLAAPGNRAQQP